MQEGKGVAGDVFPVLGEAAAAVEPGQGALDDPAARQQHKAFRLVGALDDFNL